MTDRREADAAFSLVNREVISDLASFIRDLPDDEVERTI